MKDKIENPILDLLFAGHHVRFFPREPQPWPVRIDVARALGIHEKGNDGFENIPPEWQDTVLIEEVCELVTNQLTSTGKSRARHTQRMVIISPEAAMMLAFRSRKAEAKAFVKWLLEDVLGEYVKYGTVVAGTDPAERCKLLWHRMRVERAREIDAANSKLKESGLQTIALFRELNDVAVRDVLSLARLAAQCAIEKGENRTRVFTKQGMRRAYSEAVLRSAHGRLQPHLPFPEAEEG